MRVRSVIASGAQKNIGAVLQSVWQHGSVQSTFGIRWIDPAKNHAVARIAAAKKLRLEKIMIHTARAAPLRVAAWVKVWGLGGTLGLKPNLNLVQLRGSHSFKAWLRRLPCQTARWVHPEHEWPLAKATEGRRILQRDRRRFASMA